MPVPADDCVPGAPSDRFAGADASALWLREGRVCQYRGNFDGAAAWYRRAADRGDVTAVLQLAALQARIGAVDEAARLYRHAADRGSTAGLIRRAMLREDGGDRGATVALFREAADRGGPDALAALVALVEGRTTSLPESGPRRARSGPPLVGSSRRSDRAVRVEPDGGGRPTPAAAPGGCHVGAVG